MTDSQNRVSWTDPGTWTVRRRERYRPTWSRVAVVIALFVLAILVSRSCQQAQVRISKDEAIAIAERQVGFEARSTQIRLLRQGLNRKPFWFVSLSDPIGSATNPEGFTRIVVVEVDANTGKVEDVNKQGAGPPSPPTGKKSQQATTIRSAG
jgi:Peptidase propeptide and YPEB domain